MKLHNFTVKHITC